jgi:anaphase-promoting complex subunit 5
MVVQALGSGDVALCAQLYAWHADACMGLAGAATENPRLRASYVSKAEAHIDRAAKCTYSRLSNVMCRLSYHRPPPLRQGLTRILNWIGYKQIEDIRGECDTMNKKSLLARLHGDAELADDWARRYVSLYEEHFSGLSEDEYSTDEDLEDSSGENDTEHD